MRKKKNDNDDQDYADETVAAMAVAVAGAAKAATEAAEQEDHEYDDEDESERHEIHHEGLHLLQTLFVPAVVASGLLFDRGTGFFAVALSTALVALQLPWLQDPGAHIVAIAIFIVIGSGLTLISASLHHALERAHKAERETQLLLQEMSHRVKNKFAMVVSMLALQARGAASPETQAALEAVTSRVRVIARVHDYLQQSRHGGLMDMQEYLKALCGSLEEALCSHRPVRLIVSAERVPLPPDRALSVGLIVNELVTNALKY